MPITTPPNTYTIHPISVHQPLRHLSAPYRFSVPVHPLVEIAPASIPTTRNIGLYPVLLPPRLRRQFALRRQSRLKSQWGIRHFVDDSLPSTPILEGIIARMVGGCLLLKPCADEPYQLLRPIILEPAKLKAERAAVTRYALPIVCPLSILGTPLVSVCHRRSIRPSVNPGKAETSNRLVFGDVVRYFYWFAYLCHSVCIGEWHPSAYTCACARVSCPLKLCHGGQAEENRDEMTQEAREGFSWGFGKVRWEEASQRERGSEEEECGIPIGTRLCLGEGESEFRLGWVRFVRGDGRWERSMLWRSSKRE